MIFCRSWVIADAVTAMTGIARVAGSARNRPSAVMPSIPGSWMSIRTSAGRGGPARGPPSPPAPAPPGAEPRAPRPLALLRVVGPDLAELLEDRLLVLGDDTDAGVVHGDLDPAVRGRRAHLDPAALGRGVDG